MATIAEVVGWKFQHQAGMDTRAGVITAFPGGIPSQADQDKWTAEYEDHIAATEYQSKRREEIEATVTRAEVEEAIFEYLFESKPEKLQAMQDKRLQIKSKYPKPLESS